MGTTRRVPRALAALLATAVVVGLVTGAVVTVHGDRPAALTDRPPPPRAVRDAVRALVAEGRATYTLHLSVAGRTVTETGSFTMHPDATDLTRETSVVQGGDQGDVRYRSIAVDGRVYLDPGGCWTTASAVTLSRTTPLVIDVEHPMLPGVAVVAGGAMGGSYVDDASTDVNGSLRLDDVLRLVDGDLPHRLGTGPGRIGATLHIDHGVLTGFTVQPHNFAAATALPQHAYGVLGTAEVDVTFAVPADPVTVTAPDVPSAAVVSDGRTAATPSPGCAEPTAGPTGGPPGGPTGAPAGAPAGP